MTLFFGGGEYLNVHVLWKLSISWMFLVHIMSTLKYKVHESTSKYVLQDKYVSTLPPTLQQR